MRACFFFKALFPLRPYCFKASFLLRLKNLLFQCENNASVPIPCCCCCFFPPRLFCLSWKLANSCQGFECVFFPPTRAHTMLISPLSTAPLSWQQQVGPVCWQWFRDSRLSRMGDFIVWCRCREGSVVWRRALVSIKQASPHAATHRQAVPSRLAWNK